MLRSCALQAVAGLGPRVRIWTDGGAYGLGEASPMVHGNASLEIIASAFTPLLVGTDPLEPRVIQDRLFHEHIKIGPEGAYAGALAAVDIALRDLRGKVLGQPVWNSSAARGGANCPSTRRSAATAGAASTKYGAEEANDPLDVVSVRRPV